MAGLVEGARPHEGSIGRWVGATGTHGTHIVPGPPGGWSLRWLQ